MDQILGILIVTLVISILIGAIANGAQRLLGFAIIAAIATALIGMVTGSSFSLPNVVSSIQPNSGLPAQIETINPAAGSGSTSAGPASAFGDQTNAADNAGTSDATQPSSSGVASNSTPGSAGSAEANSANVDGPVIRTTPSGSSTTDAPRPVNALW
ncbi:MAG: hypothetical protein WBA10_18380 [Elainellaceae cyanobacterium]